MYFSAPSGCAAFNGYRVNLWFSLLATRLVVPLSNENVFVPTPGSVKLRAFRGHRHGHGGRRRRSWRRLRLDVRFCDVDHRAGYVRPVFLTCSLTVRALSDKGSRCIGLGPSVTSLATLCLAAPAKSRRHCVKRHSL